MYKERDDYIRLTASTDPLISLGHRFLVRLAQALCIFGICGTVGVLIDLDHIPFMLYQMLPEVYGRFAQVGGRFNHQFVFRSLFVVLFIVCAYAVGRVAQLIANTR